MDVIKPVPITDAKLISSNVSENDQPVWVAGTTYGIGAMVMYNHVIYESLQAANVGKIPSDNPLWWNRLSATNRWKMFDLSVSSQTVATGALQFTLQPNVISALALINMDGASVSVEMRDGNNAVVYSKTIELRRYNADSLHEYFFKPIEYQRFLTLTDLPSYYEGLLTITITPSIDGLAKCGLCVVGASKFIGDLEFGSGGGSIDYSTVITDAFGDTTLTPRQSANKITGTIMVSAFETDNIVRFMTGLSGIPCLWHGTDVYESSVLFGFRKDFSFAYTSHSYSIFNIEIQGFT